jgi:hypothetical protein
VEASSADRTSRSSGNRHLGVLLAALPMNQARTLWCAGAAGEVAAYRFTIVFLNTLSNEGVQAGRSISSSIRASIQFQKHKTRQPVFLATGSYYAGLRNRSTDSTTPP